ncbi:MAG: transporter substrate-binding domain-containing protein [Verrucomicrobiota bacterium]|nr:transporter substrate-binding domain-containing protein [Verrucomicrobiota bacterium]
MPFKSHRLNSGGFLLFFLISFFLICTLHAVVKVEKKIVPPLPPPPPVILPVAPVPKIKIKVGFEPKIPYVIASEKGELGGLAVELWGQIAERRNIDYDVVLLDPGDGVKAIKEGRVQVVFLATAINPVHERDIDYSVPFYNDNDAVVIKSRSLAPSLWGTIKLVFSISFIDIFIYLIIIFTFAGSMIWLIERRTNHLEFRRPFFKGIQDGLWWAVVTISTIGYGDKVAKSPAGKAISTFWIIFGIILTSVITAAFASTATLNIVKYNVNSIQDLKGLKVGVVEGTEAENILKDRRVNCLSYENYEKGFDELNKDKIDVFFGAQSALDYELKILKLDDIIQPIKTKNRDRYAFAFPDNSPLIEDVNISIMEIVNAMSWQDIELKYGL